MARTMFGSMTSWDAIISELGGTGLVADRLEQSMSTVSGWRSRGIPAPHWEMVVALAIAAGKAEITLETLAALAARKLAEARA